MQVVHVLKNGQTVSSIAGKKVKIPAEMIRRKKNDQAV